MKCAVLNEDFKPSIFAGVMSLESLLKILVDILEDESAVAVRAALTGLQLCLGNLLEGSNGCQGLEVLFDLLHVKTNPYWLVKVHYKIAAFYFFFHIDHISQTI